MGCSLVPGEGTMAPGVADLPRASGVADPADPDRAPSRTTYIYSNRYWGPPWATQKIGRARGPSPLDVGVLGHSLCDWNDGGRAPWLKVLIKTPEELRKNIGKYKNNS